MSYSNTRRPDSGKVAIRYDRAVVVRRGAEADLSGVVETGREEEVLGAGTKGLQDGREIGV